MDLFDFNVPFQISIGRTKTFMGRGKNWWERRAPMMEKPACWGRLAVLSPSPDPQLQLQLIHNCFLLYKTHSLPGNENYYMFVMF